MQMQCQMRPGGRFIEACLLCILLKSPSYGYSLAEEIQLLGEDGANIDSSVVYRNLRNMEKQGHISSKWESSDQGPRKRVYSITEQGREYLSQWVHLLSERKKKITQIIDTYEKYIKGEV